MDSTLEVITLVYTSSSEVSLSKSLLPSELNSTDSIEVTDQLVHIFGGVRRSAQTDEIPSLDNLTITKTTTTTLDTPVNSPLPASETSIDEPTTERASNSTEPTAVSMNPLVPEGQLDLLQLGVDRRLILNRKRQLKMMRVWLQVCSCFLLLHFGVRYSY